MKRQISLARIDVAAAVSSISADNITDERLDPDVCGLVTDWVSVDTTTMQAQFSSLLEKVKTELAQLHGGTAMMTKAQYDPAGDGLNICVQEYECSKSGSVYALTGEGAVGRFKVPAAWSAGDTWTVNGKAVPAYCGADAADGDSVVAGRWLLFTYDGNRLDFNGGGGLSNAKLAQATAADTDVLTGKKYYAGGKTIKEGKMPNRGSWGTTIAPGGAVTVPAGYHDGSGQVAVRAARLRRKVLGNLNTNRYEGPFSATFSVTDLPGWQNFTTENFAFSYASVNANAQDQNTGFSYSLSYNPSSGIVTVTNNYSYSGTPYFETSGTVTCVCYYAE